METTTVANKKRASRKRKLTPEENRALNASLPAGNKYVEAARIRTIRFPKKVQIALAVSAEVRNFAFCMACVSEQSEH